eukprot:1595070-Amphidinium_carterae.1
MAKKRRSVWLEKTPHLRGNFLKKSFPHTTDKAIEAPNDRSVTAARNFMVASPGAKEFGIQ